jgi:hypothetical protein
MTSTLCCSTAAPGIHPIAAGGRFVRILLVPGRTAVDVKSKSKALILYITVGYTEEFSEILVNVAEKLPARAPSGQRRSQFVTSGRCGAAKK